MKTEKNVRKLIQLLTLNALIATSTNTYLINMN